MNIKISKISYNLPLKIVTNKDLQEENPNWNMEKLSEKSGVFTRYIADKNETAFDLACKACDKLLIGDDRLKESIDGIIFCTQSPDYIMPSNSFLIHNYLNLKQTVFAFDFNLACSGFIYGLLIARGFIETSLASNILLITGDTYSKYIHPQDRSARILFGDGAAACLISETKDEGIIDAALASSGSDYNSFYIPSGGLRLPKSEKTAFVEIDESGNTHTAEHIHMNGFGIWKFVASTVPKQIIQLLEKNNYSIDDVDLFVFHQASKMTIDSLMKAVKIKPEKVFINMDKVGNLVSSSIPVVLKDAEDAQRLKRGDLILLSGFGVGLSWGTIIMRY